MACNESRSPLVPRSKSLGVLDGQEFVDTFRYNIHTSEELPPLQACDVVSDQADGARGPEQTLCLEPESCPVCQKARENGRLSARRSPKTGR